ncbi:type VI secretion system lipoprotein TssJ [Methylocaldum sp.]|uniref:type VI secretion system lipoprotein TssJ n=1 Tax=Methylocaldum sp. TaxID=1969727 RepID=UPI002D3ADC64|nr:type VI secretion system lipoprotein TssJ [Methylocaldum sp.]HYE34285.1 type VI secretion system lipoprotein TssJ [Methylocaldum sp.]
MNVATVLPVFMTFLLLAGCAADEPKPTPPPPTVLQLRIEAQPDINLDGEGRPSPLLLRVYQLRELAAFNGADFFELYQNEKSVLGADLAGKEEFILRPGEKRELSFEAKPDAKAVGIFAAYRNLDSAQWRTSAEIPPNKTSIVKLRVTTNRVDLGSPEKTDGVPAN